MNYNYNPKVSSIKLEDKLKSTSLKDMQLSVSESKNISISYNIHCKKENSNIILKSLKNIIENIFEQYNKNKSINLHNELIKAIDEFEIEKIQNYKKSSVENSNIFRENKKILKKFNIDKLHICRTENHKIIAQKKFRCVKSVKNESFNLINIKGYNFIIGKNQNSDQPYKIDYQTKAVKKMLELSLSKRDKEAKYNKIENNNNIVNNINRRRNKNNFSLTPKRKEENKMIYKFK